MTTDPQNTMPDDAQQIPGDLLAGQGDKRQKDEGHRIEHEKEMYGRENELFKHTIVFLYGLFIVGYLFALFVIIAVSCGATAWLVPIGSLALIIPTVLLGCLFHHVYSKDEHVGDSLKKFLAKNPAKDIIQVIGEQIANLIRSNK